MFRILAESMFVATRLSRRASAQTEQDRRPEKRWMEDASPAGLPDRPSLGAPDARKRAAFARLHQGPGAFVMPNAWDAGSARILEGLGFSALATTSAGLAISLGVRDSSSSLSHRQVLENARAIVDATSLPVSADLENGFGASPEACAQTIREAAEIGLCGGAIEDASGDPRDPIYDFDLAVERIRAAVAAKPYKRFLITARAENFICGRPDLADTIRRLQAFEAAGADVVYAPGLPDAESIRQVCAAVTVPVNVVVGLTDVTHTADELSRLGVRRISTGGSLARAALGGMVRAATALRECGPKGFAAAAIPEAEAARLLRLADPAPL